MVGWEQNKLIFLISHFPFALIMNSLYVQEHLKIKITLQMQKE